MGINPTLSSEGLPDVQKKNVAWMKAQTELFEAQRKYMEEVNKTKKEDWEAMTTTVKTFEKFLKVGAPGAVNRFMRGLNLGFEGALANITNIATGLLNDMLNNLKPFFDNLATIIGDIQTGLSNVEFAGTNLWDGLITALSGIPAVIGFAVDGFANLKQQIQDAADAADAAAWAARNKALADAAALSGTAPIGEGQGWDTLDIEALEKALEGLGF